MKDFSIKNNIPEIEPLTEAIVSYCKENGIDEAVCYEVRLALEEVISNTIKYGYDDHRPHTILVQVGFENRKLILEIEDDANEFNPLDAPAPDLSLPIEQKPIGRLGIYLMRSIMDQVEYRRVGAKNILRMIKCY
jgi:serine/threonine-protein kinase RsbW